MTKIAWTADWYLGFRMWGLARREVDFEIAAIGCVAEAIRQRADAILVAGDIINSNRPSPSAVKCLRKIDDMVIQAGIPLYVISGNHDASDPHWITAAVETRTGDTMGIQLIDKKLVTVNGVRIYGLPWMSKEALTAFGPEIPEAEIIMFHQLVKEFANFPNDSQICIEDLPTRKCKVLAGGDIHKGEIKIVNSTHVGYPGAIELNKKDESGAYQFIMLHFDGAKFLNYEQVPLSGRPVARFKCRTDEEVDQAINYVQKQFPGDRRPIVFLDYLLGATHDVQERLNVALDPTQHILQPLGFAEAAGAVAVLNGTPEPRMSPQEFLRHKIKADPTVIAAVEQLLTLDCQPDAVLNNWVDQQMQPA